MAGTKSGSSGATKPKWTPDTPFGPPDNPVHTSGGWLWAPLRRKWLLAKPEEKVRQDFIFQLHRDWGYSLEQMAQEKQTQSGRKSSKADIVVATSAEDLEKNTNYSVVVEVKAEHVRIDPDDYAQGESYARAMGANFLVMHNMKETSFSFLEPGAPGRRIEIETIPHADDLSDSRRLKQIQRATKAFTRDEFQRLLYECHCILRDNHKMDPGAAFDEISKILFIKMAHERRGRSQVLTEEAINRQAETQVVALDPRHFLDQLFDSTKKYYQAEKLFGKEDRIRVSLETLKRIVNKLEKFNLSDTGDDVKGIAFEKFLGQTFRGELGQFFTPRPIVDFMIEFLNPKEGDLICDPASGTGGFLIKAFEHLRNQVEQDVHAQKTEKLAKVADTANREEWPEEKLALEAERIQHEYNKQLDITDRQSRMAKIAAEQIFGVDAEARAARTSKMNMIMHGDGHGGIYYHDGLLDVHGVHEGRFDIVVTNPPFGANVGKDQRVGATDQTRVDTDQAIVKANTLRYGDKWLESYDNLAEAMRDRRPILELFDIGRDPIAGEIGVAKVRPSRQTETLFLERCLRLLKKGGRMGIVLPDGILNNPSMSWLREYVEGRAKLTAVISIPQDVFASSKATVKTSLVFLDRFTEEEETKWAESIDQARKETASELAEKYRELDELDYRVRIYDRPELANLVDEIDTLTNATPPNQKDLRVARSKLRSALTEDDRSRAKQLNKELISRRAELDRLAEEMTRQRARVLFSYPVFMAEVESAGITATGETGEHVSNGLPRVLADARKFLQDREGFMRHSQEKLSMADSQESA
ncbi:type I restriction enzyme M protein [Saccharopolyspora shandongensis]|uniref:Type I restriction enzyme M protein n=1 Tax=Saccharopolyspora shandongensis TaxID=418495 RepID=A0A1H3M1X9_9PSEU|nr:N-6 DNA methylase [Saccharopolyspora shandongensis]SDY70747.1 type I restriction enzyme M protein [Saccharopolyspora shandongensis]